MVLVVKNLPDNAGDKRCRFDSQVRKSPWRRTWQPAPVFLPGEFHGQRNLVDYSSWGLKESDMTEWLTLLHTSTLYLVYMNIILNYIISLHNVSEAKKKKDIESHNLFYLKNKMLMINNVAVYNVCVWILFFKINFYWSLVGLQCCVTFYCIAKWISSVHRCIPSFLDHLFSFR